ncbi:MAG: carboxypeptidase-like regulatory domain-containing protein [Bacteroidales bacterium]|jgi:hypothetical protein|nr:carboxypeptidase-like regulatory domain-containing protein [Bacteroidales bacterium]
MKKLPLFLSIAALGLALNGFATGEGVPAPAGASTVSGKVVDLKSGETLAGVAVSIEGTETKVYTDLDGNFVIENVQPGTYNLVLSMISYKNSLVENVELLPNEKEVLEVKLDNK